jgi:hypothetical protein
MTLSLRQRKYRTRGVRSDREEQEVPKEPTKAAVAAMKRELRKLKTSELRARYERQVRETLIEALIDEDAMKKACEEALKKYITEGAQKIACSALGFRQDTWNRWELDTRTEGLAMVKELGEIAWAHARSAVVQQATTLFDKLTKEQLAGMQKGIQELLSSEVREYLEAEADAQIKALKDKLKLWLTEDGVICETEDE